MQRSGSCLGTPGIWDRDIWIDASEIFASRKIAKSFFSGI